VNSLAVQSPFVQKIFSCLLQLCCLAAGYKIIAKNPKLGKSCSDELG